MGPSTVSLLAEVCEDTVSSTTEVSVEPGAKLTTAPLLLKVYGRLRAWVEVSFPCDMGWVATGVNIVEVTWVGDTTGMLSGRDLEQTRVGVNGVTVSAEVKRKVVSALVATGVGCLHEGTGVSVREGTVMGVILTENTVASEVVGIDCLWLGTGSLVVEAV